MVKIYNARDVVEANRVVNHLWENGIASFYQNAAAGVTAHDVSGFGLFGVDVFVDDKNAEASALILQKWTWD